MFKMGIVSDSHAHKINIEQVAKQFDDCDAVAHLGDVVSDAKDIAKLIDKPVYMVRGNCDMFKHDVGEEMTLQLGGRKLLLCHGHRYNVKLGLTRLLYRAEEVKADIVLFGHTHIPYASDHGGIYLFNPGALMLGHYGTLAWDENEITEHINRL